MDCFSRDFALFLAYVFLVVIARLVPYLIREHKVLVAIRGGVNCDIFKDHYITWFPIFDLVQIDKWHYNGVMKIRYDIAQGSYQLSRLEIDLSKEAQVRLSWFDYYRNHQHNACLTCRHFGISPQTFYRWQRRYDPHHRKTLKTHSCRPKRVRQLTYTLAQIEAVRKVWECYCLWQAKRDPPLVKNIF